MQPDFTHTLALAILAALLWIGLLWPILLVYSGWRLLRDVRRIAEALERAHPPRGIFSRAPGSQTPQEAPETEGVKFSAFGR